MLHRPTPLAYQLVLRSIVPTLVIATGVRSTMNDVCPSWTLRCGSSNDVELTFHFEIVWFWSEFIGVLGPEPRAIGQFLRNQ
jgi:hypothetical protein